MLNTMKAIDIIKRICINSSIVDYGTDVMVMDIDTTDKKHLDAYCAGYFGTTDESQNYIPWVGERVSGKSYLYIYIPNDDVDYVYGLMGKPDAYCERENDTVALWMIE